MALARRFVGPAPTIQIGEPENLEVLSNEDAYRVMDNLSNLGLRLQGQLGQNLGGFRDEGADVLCSRWLVVFLKTALMHAWNDDSFTLKRLQMVTGALPTSIWDRNAHYLEELQVLSDFEGWDWLQDIVNPIYFTPQVAVSRRYPMCVALQRTPSSSALISLKHLGEVLDEALRKVRETATTYDTKQIRMFLAANVHPCLWEQLPKEARELLKQHELQYNPEKPSLYIKKADAVYLWPPRASPTGYIKVNFDGPSFFFDSQNRYRFELPLAAPEEASRLMQELATYFTGEVVGILGYSSRQVSLGTEEDLQCPPCARIRVPLRPSRFPERPLRLGDFYFTIQTRKQNTNLRSLEALAQHLREPDDRILANVAFAANIHPCMMFRFPWRAQGFLKERVQQYQPEKPSFWLSSQENSLLYVWPPQAERSGFFKFRLLDEANRYAINTPQLTRDETTRQLQRLLDELLDETGEEVEGVVVSMSRVCSPREEQEGSCFRVTNQEFEPIDPAPRDVRPRRDHLAQFYRFRLAVFA